MPKQAGKNDRGSELRYAIYGNETVASSRLLGKRLAIRASDLGEPLMMHSEGRSTF